ncbi:hypothetical protein DPMN_172119 [Dreissena polymorpha]|uniref:Uncharacterized protein n=1 Tax=Dreissena polymorpha TaxID=45954 RepID=A0A9D4IG82_DREPO|nr:hypothetical protein DPMN_172119 [Dreissena polymorpha]
MDGRRTLSDHNSSPRAIAQLRYARGGRFSATAARAPSYVRQVAARLRLKESAVLAAHVKALRIEGTEAPDGRPVVSSASWCIHDRDHCEALCRPSILPSPSGSSGWLPPLRGHLPYLRCTSARCPCYRTTAPTISYARETRQVGRDELKLARPSIFRASAVLGRDKPSHGSQARQPCDQASRVQ